MDIRIKAAALLTAVICLTCLTPRSFGAQLPDTSTVSQTQPHVQDGSPTPEPASSNPQTDTQPVTEPRTQPSSEPQAPEDSAPAAVYNDSPSGQEQRAHTYQPRIMVTGYTVGDGYVQPDSAVKISIILKNMSSQTDVGNIKLSFKEPAGQIVCEGTGTEYLQSLGAGESYKWIINAKAAKTAQSGELIAAVTAEYEDAGGGSYSVTEDIRITVRQSVSLQYDGAQLPAKAVQGQTATLTVNLMNTGRSSLRNVMLSFDIDGLESGGSVLVGTIESGESKSGTANFNVDTQKLGEVKGELIIGYEDDYGQTYEQRAPLSTIIVEKVQVAQKAPEEQKPSLWWLFLIIGTAAGGAAGFGAAIIIKNNKQRRIDEQTL